MIELRQNHLKYKVYLIALIHFKVTLDQFILFIPHIKLTQSKVNGEHLMIYVPICMEILNGIY